MGVAIRRAGEADREAVNKLLDEAFQRDPVSSWVFPDEEDRRRTHGRLMGGFLGMALADGYVDVTEDGSACALWLSMPAEPHADPEGPAQFREMVDPGNPRIEQIAHLMDTLHPKGRAHEYLMLIAVDEHVRGQGTGAALISHVLDRCDREGLPAYLEASSARSRGLYERLGFAFLGTPVELPDGPFMYPMWREPRSAGAAS